jgi:hypothetical protein
MSPQNVSLHYTCSDVQELKLSSGNLRLVFFVALILVRRANNCVSAESGAPQEQV